MTGADGLQERPATGFVASKRHTVTLLLALAALAIAGAVLPRFLPGAGLENAGRLSIYLQILLTQAALFLYVRAESAVRQGPSGNLSMNFRCGLRAAPFIWGSGSQRLCSG